MLVDFLSVKALVRVSMHVEMDHGKDEEVVLLVISLTSLNHARVQVSPKLN